MSTESIFVCAQKLRVIYGIYVLWSGRVGSIGPVAFKGEVVFGPERDHRTHPSIFYSTGTNYVKIK